MDITQVIMVGILVGVTFFRKDIILYLVTSPVLMAVGLAWYDSYSTPAGMITSLCLMVMGIYSFAMGIWNMLKRDD